MNSSNKAQLSELLIFWFAAENRKAWFNSTPEFDEILSDKFTRLFESGISGDFEALQLTARQSLALIIVFDQLPLNIFRGQKKCYESEILALDIAKSAIQQSFDAKLNDSEKSFLYMPFMHSELIENQIKSCELYEKAGLKESLRFAKHHRDIINQFGRFPHRNEILSRQSTIEEIHYLTSKNAFLG